MAIKSILVHVANDPRHEDRLNFAVDLCRHVAGHLEVVFTVDPITMPAGAAGRAASNAFLAEARAIAHERVETLRQTVANHFSGSDLSYEFQIVTGDQVKELARRAHLADLVIVGQSPFAGDDHVVVKKMENLVIHTGCPLLVLPFAGAYPGDMADFCRRILVAWDYGAPAIKAVRGALPLLARADTVTVVTNTPAKGDDLNGTELGRYLSLHDVHADIRATIDPGADVADQLLAQALDARASLVVLGAFGGLTLIEHFFGGVTEHVLERTDVPVFMAH